MERLSLFDSNINLLKKTLDLRSANQRVIASNIANADTPGYTPSHLEFEQELQQAIQGKGLTQVTHPNHIPLGASDLSSVTGTIVKDPDTTGIGDQNGVSIDQEMMDLSENELIYETAAQLLKKKLSQLSYVIQGGQ
ncbi:MAG: flagellar basal body rod protein FlgB [Proteobacteria bacterium]|nr:flagellar basal body rod protein FlgB [Pseudomonadota bacterium]MBU1649762.1 flagellar basal body rod protein FlgB [Pseudomonadota bacterium]